MAFRRAQIFFRTAPLYSHAAGGTLIDNISRPDMIYYNSIHFYHLEDHQSTVRKQFKV